ncbi:MAG: ATP-dependent helicase [Chitinispirillales bacterium]|jgi:superfamily I DNA/RNA helicase|nr:ATP-dependent helicase [Chitinispirillales bacterium]
MSKIHLDDRQTEAVNHTNGALLILAGAGSGKTRVLTARTQRLICENIAKPEEILALTFTNKAAKEMRKRIANAVGSGLANRMTIGTFHSLGVKILRNYGQYLNLHTNFTILSENDQISTVKTAIRDLGSKKIAQIPPQDLLNEISLTKNAGIFPEDLKNNVEKRAIGKIYEQYCKILNKRQSVDFDDLLLLPLKLFQEKPKILEEFREKYKFVSVDEFQDTNSAQLKFVRLISSPHNNLMVVGDDDQGIYSWRGAQIQNILNFHLFANAKTVILNRNYRSARQIVEAANAVISKNTRRKAKDIVSVLDAGEPISTYKGHDEEDEIRFIVDKICDFVDKKTYDYNDFALLLRTNLLMREFEDAFRKKKIPYIIHGGMSFYDKREVKDVFAYLNFFANKFDELSLSRILDVPNKGFTASAISAVDEQAGLKKISLWDSYELYENLEGEISDSQYAILKKFVLFMQKYIQKFAGDEFPSKVLRELLEELKYIEILKKIEEDEKKLENRIENVNEILNMLEKYESRHPNDMNLGDFLQNISLNSGENNSDFNVKAVVMMTMHKSKGLEFPVVFIPVLDDVIMPSKKSIEEGKIEEERRLFYVSMTRAKKQLFLSFPRFKQVRKRAMEVKPCRFLNDIPLECLDGKIGEKQDVEYKLIMEEMFRKAQAELEN